MTTIYAQTPEERAENMTRCCMQFDARLRNGVITTPMIKTGRYFNQRRTVCCRCTGDVRKGTAVLVVYWSNGGKVQGHICAPCFAAVNAIVDEPTDPFKVVSSE